MFGGLPEGAKHRFARASSNLDDPEGEAELT